VLASEIGRIGRRADNARWSAHRGAEQASAPTD
jgi:hypothetical protein